MSSENKLYFGLLDLKIISCAGYPKNYIGFGSCINLDVFWKIFFFTVFFKGKSQGKHIFI